MSHTPGPWKTGREDMQSYTGDGKPMTNIYHETLKDGFHLGNALPLTIGRAEGENSKANARLIAAAPDLLEACHAICLAMSSAPSSKLEAALNAAYEQCRTAISKAEPK